MNKPKQYNGPLSQVELFQILRDVHENDESCWKAVQEAQEIYSWFKRQVSVIDEDCIERFCEEAA